ncbi:hypothetical protein GCM10009758_16060 [Microbacterium hatanonis]
MLTDFYEHHAAAGSGPRVNPVLGPAWQASAREMAGDFSRKGRSIGRQKVPKAAPRSIPDEAFDALFTLLGCDRDRALVSLYLSTGARAAELLSMNGASVDFANDRVRVVRKGGSTQWLPTSPDAMVWLRLYLGPRRLGLEDALWLTRRRPYRPLLYPAVRQAFRRAQDSIGSVYTLHQLRHTAAYRLSRDPSMSITDVQWVLGHAHIGTTQLYAQARPEDIYLKMIDHHRRVKVEPPMQPIAGGYKPESLQVLFGTDK